MGGGGETWVAQIPSGIQISRNLHFFPFHGGPKFGPSSPSCHLHRFCLHRLHPRLNFIVSLYVSGMLARTIIDFNNLVKVDESCNKNPTLRLKPQEKRREVGMYVVGLGSRESGHSPHTFSLGVICSATIQVRRTTNTADVGPMCGLHNTVNHGSWLKMPKNGKWKCREMSNIRKHPTSKIRSGRVLCR